VVADSEGTLYFNSSLFIFNTTETLGEVKERHTLEEFVDLTIAD
jgi:hypothetical protein